MISRVLGCHSEKTKHLLFTSHDSFWFRKIVCADFWGNVLEYLGQPCLPTIPNSQMSLDAESCIGSGLTVAATLVTLQGGMVLSRCAALYCKSLSLPEHPENLVSALFVSLHHLACWCRFHDHLHAFGLCSICRRPLQNELSGRCFDL